MCGGNGYPVCGAVCAEGLSPRVRGKPIPSCSWPPCLRSIPACAGETPGAVSSTFATAVYPRVCGGNCSFVRPIEKAVGLSPRVRGKRPHPTIGKQRRRSIPACAGETCRLLSLACRLGVYPRVCGGNGNQPPVIKSTGGLSPRVRGKRCRGRHSSPAARSIPACAGKPVQFYPHNHVQGSIPACAGETAGRDVGAADAAVYPRVCGGNSVHCSITHRSRGLSPRVRGKQLVLYLEELQLGSIPACAGETAVRQSGIPSWRVYPRVCGGNALPPRRG